MKFTKNNTPWNKGKKTGLIPKTAFKKGQKPVNKGLGQFKKGHKGLWKGKKFSIEHRSKISLSHKGDKSYLWRGGVTTKNQSIRHSFEYKLWRQAVFERDNYTCIWCRQKGGKLNADHIKPFAFYPELRFAIDNGRTLCIDCHKKTDTFMKRLMIKNLKDKKSN